MTWNLLNFSENATDRAPYMRTVLDSMKPELLAVQEIAGEAGAHFFRDQVLQGTMAMAPFQPGPNTNNALFYDSLLFSSVSMTVIPTALRDINQYTLRHLNSGDTLHIFSVHLKSSSGAANETLRKAEVDSLRRVTNALPPESYFIVCGDFNFYGSNDLAYSRLLQQDGTNGYFIDPIAYSGTWNTEEYAIHHTQSPRSRSFGGGASGGLDDRFDLILFSHSFGPNGAIRYEYNTSWAVGNDGQHYNDSINHPPNLSVSQNIANALHYASDHLPVVTSFKFYNTLSITAYGSKGQVLAYPNPTDGKLTIELQQAVKSVDVTITDAYGKRVSTHSFLNAKVFNLNITGHTGVYSIQLTTETV
ncbi:T9SS type A sorting domain-containing protein, partial [Flavobacteriales bacterium]|nr:T9SS type A sorting domain-containing protein [Flavobacteriales bacterium]